jgi:hypothetical protein
MGLTASETGFPDKGDPVFFRAPWIMLSCQYFISN